MMDFLGNHRFYTSVVLSAIWPIILLFLLYRRKRREQGAKQGVRQGKTHEESQRDRELFSSIGGAKEGENGAWPLGYAGYDPKLATDEVIERFIQRKDSP